MTVVGFYVGVGDGSRFLSMLVKARMSVDVRGTVGLFVGVGARGWVEAEGDGYRSMGWREGVGIGV